MNRITAAIYGESQKTLLKKKTIVIMMLTALIPIVAALAVSSLQNRTGIFALGAAGYPVWILGFFTNYLLPLFIFMTAADLFAGEISDGSLKLVLVRPVTRFKVFIAKISAIGVLIIFTLGIAFVSSMIGNLFLNSTGNGLLSGLISGIIAYSTAILPMIGLGVLASFVSLLVRSGSGALTASIFVYIACSLLPAVWPQAGKFMLVSYTSWHLMWLGAMGASRIVYALMFILSNMIIFLAGGYYLFDQKDF